METDKSIIFDEVLETLQSPSYVPNARAYKASLQVDGSEIPSSKVMSLDVKRDYINRRGDEVLITLKIPMGTLIYDIMPNKDKIELTLTSILVSELSDDDSISFSNIAVDRAMFNPANSDKLFTVGGGGFYAKTDYSQAVKYKAVLIKDDTPEVTISGNDIPDRDTADNSKLMEVEFQLIPLNLDDVRFKAMGTIFKESTLSDVIRVMLGKTTPDIRGVDICELTNKGKFPHTVIKPNVKVIELPHYLQNKYGLYDSGLGCYLQGDLWYVFPLASHERVNETPRTLTIVNVPKDRFASAESTYLIDNYGVKMVATGDVAFKDDSDTSQLVLGNGIRYGNSDNMLASVGGHDPDKLISDRSTNISEYIIGNREDGDNLVGWSKDFITHNHCLELSKLKLGKCATLQVVWERSNSGLLYPGMPVKYLYQGKGEDGMKEMIGTLVGVDYSSTLNTKNITSNKHNETALLTILTSRPK